MDVFVEPRLPAPRIAVAGSSPAARGLARLAQAVGYRVLAVVSTPGEVLSHADDTIAVEALSGRISAPEDAIVVATMSRYDDEVLHAALETEAGYAGLVATRARATQVGDRLRAKGVPEQQLERVVSPAGLDLGPVSWEEIGLAVLAEVVGLRRRTRGERMTGCAPGTGRRSIRPDCGMTVAVISSTPRASVSGQTFFFCSEGCRAAFVNGREQAAR